MQPGETRNPAGSSAKARAMAKVRRLSSDQLAELTSMLLLSSRADLQKLLKDGKSNFLQEWTAKLLAQSFNKGDVAIYRAVLDRVVGKPKETVAVGGDEAAGPLRVDMRTREEKLERLEALRAARQQVEEHERGNTPAQPAGE